MAEIMVEPLVLGSVELPEWHPRAEDGTCLIQSFLVHHPDGPMLIDTGVAADNEIINELYRPTVVPVVDALNDRGVDERDLVAIVNTHLHFDHCGQTRSLPAVPVFVQRAEVEATRGEHYTVPAWAHIEESSQRLIDGDEEIAPMIRLLATPGHTPGHQSVLIGRDGDRQHLLVGQACYTCAEFEAGEAAPSDMHDASFVEAGAQSLRRLRELAPAVVHWSHDRTVLVREVE